MSGLSQQPNLKQEATSQELTKASTQQQGEETKQMLTSFSLLAEELKRQQKTIEQQGTYLILGWALALVMVASFLGTILIFNASNTGEKITADQELIKSIDLLQAQLNTNKIEQALPSAPASTQSQAPTAQPSVK